MPMIPTKTSSASRQAFEAGLAHLVRLGRVSDGLEVDPNPQPVYVLGHDEASGTYDVKTAKLVGWRFFAGGPSNEIVVGKVSTTTAAPTVNSMRYGNAARHIFEATQALEKLANVEGNDFSLRILRIPEALIEGFWLKPASDGNGLIVPFGKSFAPDKQEGKPQNIDTFLSDLMTVGKPSTERENRQNSGASEKDVVERIDALAAKDPLRGF